MSRLITHLFALFVVLALSAPLTAATDTRFRTLMDTTAEGVDGVFEGNNEGDTSTTVSTTGTGATAAGSATTTTTAGTTSTTASTTATPAADEGDDGVFEGEGEGLAVPAADEGADGVFEGSGEGANTPEGADGVFEGNNEGDAPAPVEAEEAAVEEASGVGKLGTSMAAAAAIAAVVLM